MLAIFLALLFDIAERPEILLFLWIIYGVLDYTWGGLANFIRILFFPGTLIHRLSHIVIYKLKGEKPRFYTIQTFRDERPRVSLRIRDMRSAALLAVSPAVIAIPMYILTLFLLIYSNSLIAKLIAAWLAISFFVTGFPNLSDLSYIISGMTAHDPLFQFLLLWSIVVFVIGINAVGLGYAVIVAISYVLLLTLIVAYRSRRREVPIVVYNED